MALEKLIPTKQKLNCKTVKITMLCHENCRITRYDAGGCIPKKRHVEAVYRIPEVCALLGYYAFTSMLIILHK
jgi:hypothetical protein